MKSDKRTWVEMSNGQILADIPFVVWVCDGEGREGRLEFTAPNLPVYHGDPNLYSRLSFECIKARFKAWGFDVSHIIRGECSESGVRDCYVYQNGYKVPFAVIRPAVFAR